MRSGTKRVWQFLAYQVHVSILRNASSACKEHIGNSSWLSCVTSVTQQTRLKNVKVILLQKCVFFGNQSFVFRKSTITLYIERRRTIRPACVSYEVRLSYGKNNCWGWAHNHFFMLTKTGEFQRTPVFVIVNVDENNTVCVKGLRCTARSVLHRPTGTLFLRSTLISRRQFRDGSKSYLFADAYFWSSENIRYKSVMYLLTYLRRLHCLYSEDFLRVRCFIAKGCQWSVFSHNNLTADVSNSAEFCLEALAAAASDARRRRTRWSLYNIASSSSSVNSVARTHVAPPLNAALDVSGTSFTSGTAWCGDQVPADGPQTLYGTAVADSRRRITGEDRSTIWRVCDLSYMVLRSQAGVPSDQLATGVPSDVFATCHIWYFGHKLEYHLTSLRLEYHLTCLRLVIYGTSVTWWSTIWPACDWSTIWRACDCGSADELRRVRDVASCSASKPLSWN